MIVDLNCDMGEGFGVYRLGDDAEMLTVATSANIACGFHAGDPLVMHETLSRAAANGVQAGAHPSFLDLWGFGRRPIHGERPADIEKAVLYQVGALLALAQDAGCPVRHVKTHGAMGNMANEDADLALAVARAIRTLDRDLIFVVMPGLETERAGEKLGLPIAREIYAELERWMQRRGAAWVRLGVVVGNTRAERFWERQGFVEVRRRDGLTMGERVNALRVMIKPLDGGLVEDDLVMVPRDRPGAP